MYVEPSLLILVKRARHVGDAGIKNGGDGNSREARWKKIKRKTKKTIDGACRARCMKVSENYLNRYLKILEKNGRRM